MKIATALAIISTAFIVGWTRHRLEQWDRAVSHLQELVLHPSRDLPAYYLSRNRQDLPELVQNHLAKSSIPSHGLVRPIESVQFSQKGSFRSSPQEAFADFEAHEVLTLTRPGLVWEASIAWVHSLARMWPYRQVCDVYMGEQSVQRRALLSVMDVKTEETEGPLATTLEERQRNLAYAMRWMAEMLLIPGAIHVENANRGVKWKSIDESRVLLKFADVRLRRAELAVTFNNKTGLIHQAVGRRPRWEPETQTYTEREWIVQYGNYQQTKEGFLIPSTFSVGWLADSGVVDWYMHRTNFDFEFEYGESGSTATSSA